MWSILFEGHAPNLLCTFVFAFVSEMTQLDNTHDAEFVKCVSPKFVYKSVFY